MCFTVLHAAYELKAVKAFDDKVPKDTGANTILMKRKMHEVICVKHERPTINRKWGYEDDVSHCCYRYPNFYLTN